MNKKLLRLQINKKRRDLSEDFQQQASQLICAKLARHPKVLSATTVATYHSIHGEANPFPLVKSLDKQWLLPIVSGEKMQFVNFHHQGNLIKNGYGILEPIDKTSVVATSGIDVILAPLVSFDVECNRIGRGAGHYDRALAFMQQATGKKPYLIGIAYEFQRIDKIERESWDIPLDEVITEKREYR